MRTMAVVLMKPMSRPTFHTLFAGNMRQFGAPGSDPATAEPFRHRLTNKNEQALLAQKDIVSFQRRSSFAKT
jgi:hypothetical protein